MSPVDRWKVLGLGAANLAALWVAVRVSYARERAGTAVARRDSSGRPPISRRTGPNPVLDPEAAAAWRRERRTAGANMARYGSPRGRCGHLGWYPGCPNCGGRRAT